jgi:hypothetical protein
MKRFHLLKTILIGFPIICVIYSCEGGVDILAGRYVAGIYDPWGTPVTRATPPTVYIDCPTG